MEMKNDQKVKKFPNSWLQKKSRIGSAQRRQDLVQVCHGHFWTSVLAAQIWWSFVYEIGGGWTRTSEDLDVGIYSPNRYSKQE